jgi:hypothetical protein
VRRALPHLKASPAFSYTDRVEMTKRRRIVELLNQSQRRTFVARFVVAPEIVTAPRVVLRQSTLPYTYTYTAARRSARFVDPLLG